MKIERTECNYQVTECDLKFGEQITLNGEPLIPLSVLEKIRAEIEQRPYGIANDSVIRGMKCERAEILEIIDKYRGE